MFGSYARCELILTWTLLILSSDVTHSCHSAKLWLLMKEQWLDDILCYFINLSASCNISKMSVSVPSGVPNPEKQVKAQGRRPSVFV